MGVVYAADDPELGRRVAIKRLHPEGHQRDDLRQRLLREAQALARLAHPNVVTLLDVGAHGEAVFLAMELVEGITLAEWMREPRPWREVLRVFLEAGKGLEKADAVTVQNAPELTAALEGLTGCRETPGLTSRPPPPDDLRPRVDAARHTLAQARAHSVARRAPEYALLREDARQLLVESLRKAVAVLPEQERALLRLHHFHGFTMDRLTLMYGGSRSGVARRVADARELLLERVRMELAPRLKQDQLALESLLGLVNSRLDISLHGMLD